MKGGEKRGSKLINLNAFLQGTSVRATVNANTKPINVAESVERATMKRLFNAVFMYRALLKTVRKSPALGKRNTFMIG